MAAAVLYAVVASGTVINTILWDGEADWSPPANTEVVVIPEGATSIGNGATYANGAFSPAVVDAPTPTPASEYAALIMGGLAITSTGTSALNGVYPIDEQSQSDIATEAQFISTFAEFTTGGTTNLPWAQASGTFIQFPTTAAFLSFAKAAGQLVAAAKLAAAQSNAMPSSSVTIP
jgi:hypothetical protein